MNFLGSKTEYRCDPAHHGFEHVEHRSLGGFSRQAVVGCGVKPVFDDIQVKRAHVHGAEMMDFLVNLQKLVIVIGRFHLLLQSGRAVHSPAIQRQQILRIKYLPG